MSINGTNGHATRVPAATKLRRMIEDPNGFVFAPGVYDGFSARLVESTGFDCLYMVRYVHAQSRSPISLDTTVFSICAIPHHLFFSSIQSLK